MTREGNFVVVRKDLGRYVLASRRVFFTRRSAEAYAMTLGASQEPLVVEGCWGELRWTPTPEER